VSLRCGTTAEKSNARWLWIPAFAGRRKESSRARQRCLHRAHTLAEAPIFRHARRINKTLWRTPPCRMTRVRQYLRRRPAAAVSWHPLRRRSLRALPPGAGLRAKPSRTLIKGGWSELRPRRRRFRQGRCADRRQQDRGGAADISAQATVIDATDMIVLPVHRHSPSLLSERLRNILANGLLSDYSATFRRRHQSLPSEDAYIGNLIGALRALDAGITTITDLSQVSNTPEHSDALIKGLKDPASARSMPIRAAPGPARAFRTTSSASRSSISPRRISS